MQNILKHLVIIALSIILVSCGSGDQSSGNNTPVITDASGINLGNISTIPLAGTSSNTTVILTNNMHDPMNLQSATYTLYSGSNSFIPLPADNADSPINVSQCTTLPARGVCNIMVHAPITSGSGQYLITMSYIDVVTNKTYTTSQIVSYSDAIPVNPNGIIYASNNNNVYNQTNGNTTLVIPFVLTESFNNITATSDKNNPAFAPTISCPGNSYTAGNLCTLYIMISATNTNSVVSGNITVNSEAPQVTSLKSVPKSLSTTFASSGKSLQGTIGYLFNVPVTVVKNNTGNLVTSAVNIVINPANGNSGNAQTVTLLNNGSAAISGINIAATSPLAITNNTCTGTLSAPSGTCTFSINVSSAQAISGQAPVTLTYNNGASSGSTTGSLSFNVVYVAATPGPAMTMTSGQGSLNNVPIGTTQYFDVLVTNSGNVTFNNITFTNTAVTSLSYDSSSTCATNGTQSLVPGASCTLVLKYAPTAIASASTVTINETATYTYGSGSTNTYASASSAIPYSAITSYAFVYITPNAVAFAIRADGNDTQTQTFTITNSGGESTTLTTITVTPAVTAFTNLGTGTCSTGGSQGLASGASCTLIYQYGTTTGAQSLTSAQLQALYKPDVSSVLNSTAFSNLTFTSSLAALVKVNGVSVPTGSGVSGSGTAASPYTFINSPAVQINFTITYTNSGTAAANNFNVALNNLPIGYAVIPGSTTCGYESSTTTLSASSSCNVAFTAVNASGLYNPYALTGVFNVNIPGYSYTDTNTGLNTAPFPLSTSGPSIGSNVLYVTMSNLSSAVTPANPTWTTGTTGTPANSYIFTGSATAQYVVAIPSTSLQGFTVGNSRTCTTPTSSPFQCTISITNPAGFPIGVTVNFDYTVAPLGSTGGIIQQASFSYSS